jgi:hypothetical protein
LTKGEVKIPWAARMLLKFLNPKKTMKFLSGKQLPEIVGIMLKSMDIMSLQLSRVALKDKRIDKIINPSISDIGWADFGKVNILIKRGEEAAKKAMPKIKRLLYQE